MTRLPEIPIWIVIHRTRWGTTCWAFQNEEDQDAKITEICDKIREDFGLDSSDVELLEMSLDLTGGNDELIVDTCDLL